MDNLGIMVILFLIYLEVLKIKAATADLADKFAPEEPVAVPEVEPAVEEVK